VGVGHCYLDLDVVRVNIKCAFPVFQGSEALPASTTAIAVTDDNAILVVIFMFPDYLE